MSPDFIITITEENGSLYAKTASQQKVEIFPQSGNVFFFKVVDARITFVRNEAGKVTELILRETGREIRAKKIK